MLTEDQLRQLLKELPERGPRSRLDSFRELIVEMRNRQYSYRDISRFLAERCGVQISHNEVRNFLNRHCSGLPEPSPPAVPDRRSAGEPSSIRAEPPEPRRGEQPQAVRDRIAALKRRSHPTSDVGTSFRFDPAQPLTLPDE
jgi:hypothetical protein